MLPAERALHSLVQKAIHDFRLIEEGDRILIAVSGGKDSTALARALAVARRAVKKRFELAALHLSNDFAAPPSDWLRARMADWDIPYEEMRLPVAERLKPGRKLNCYWCSTQRRTELLRYAMARGFTSLALGHHMDDIIETVFMNMVGKGRLLGMPVAMRYDKYPVRLIRPLALLEERQIIEYANEAGLLAFTCSCGYGENSARRAMRAKLADFLGGSSEAKRRVFRAFAESPVGVVSGEIRIEQCAAGEHPAKS